MMDIARYFPSDKYAAENYLRKCIIELYWRLSNPMIEGKIKRPNLVGFVTVYEGDLERDLISLAETTRFVVVINELGLVERINSSKIIRYVMWTFEDTCNPERWNPQMKRLFDRIIAQADYR